MKVFFTVSNSGLPVLLPDCQQIVSELRSQGASVVATFDKGYWRGTSWAGKSDGLVDSENKGRYAHDRALRRAIFQADAVVVEASYPSFRLGFEAFFALSQQKPVLVLSKLRNYSHLIDQPSLFGAKYTGFTLPDEIAKFLRRVKKNKLRYRFNLFVSDEHVSRIENGAKRYGVSMSDYVRKLIESDRDQ